MFKALLFVLILAVAGCAGLAADPSKMSPEQLKANAKDKNASVACWNGKTAAGNVTMTYVNADQAMRLGSQVIVKTDCETVVNTTSFEPPPKAASAP